MICGGGDSLAATALRPTCHGTSSCRVAMPVLRAACCVLRAVCCVLCAACCVLRAACCDPTLLGSDPAQVVGCGHLVLRGAHRGPQSPGSCCIKDVYVHMLRCCGRGSHHLYGDAHPVCLVVRHRTPSKWQPMSDTPPPVFHRACLSRSCSAVCRALGHAKRGVHAEALPACCDVGSDACRSCDVPEGGVHGVRPPRQTLLHRQRIRPHNRAGLL